MKKNILRIALSAIFVALFSIACISTTDDGYTCIKTPTGCGTVLSCSDGSSSYYDWNGTKYWCDGKDCDAAVDDVLEDMCGKSQSCEEPKEITREKLIDGSYDVLEEKNR